MNVVNVAASTGADLLGLSVNVVNIVNVRYPVRMGKNLFSLWVVGEKPSPRSPRSPKRIRPGRSWPVQPAVHIDRDDPMGLSLDDVPTEPKQGSAISSEGDPQHG